MAKLLTDGPEESLSANDKKHAAASGPADLWSRLLGIPPKRLLALSGALAVAAIALAIAVIATAGGNSTATTASTGGGALEVVGADAPTFWTANVPRSWVTTGTSIGGEPATVVDLNPAGRKTFAFLRHDFAQPLNWSQRPFFVLDVRGTDSRTPFQVTVTFSGDGQQFATYDLRDDFDGWRRLAFNTMAPTAHKGDLAWSNVVGIRVSADKTANVKMAFGALRVSPAVSGGK